VRSLTLLFLFAYQLAFAKQEVVVQNLVCATARHAETSSLQVKFDLLFSETYVDVLKRGDSSDMYFVEVRLKCANEYVKVSKGFMLFADSMGQVLGVLRLPLSETEKRYTGLQVFLPLAALQLPSGEQQVQAEISLVDRWGRVLGKRWLFPPFLHKQPQLLHLHVSVQSILVDSLNHKGETWDYAGAASTEKALPDLVWHVLFMNKKLSVSSIRQNTILYEDFQNLNDVEFAITKDDAFSLAVYDYDMPSYSDKIGQIKIDINDMQKFSGSVFTTSSGKLRKMEFIITIL